MTDYTGERPKCDCGRYMTWERVCESDTTGYWSGEVWFCRPCNDLAGKLMDYPVLVVIALVVGWFIGVAIRG